MVTLVILVITLKSLNFLGYQESYRLVKLVTTLKSLTVLGYRRPAPFFPSRLIAPEALIPMDQKSSAPQTIKSAR